MKLSSKTRHNVDVMFFGFFWLAKQASAMMASALNGPKTTWCSEQKYAMDVWMVVSIVEDTSHFRIVYWFGEISSLFH